MRFIRLIILIVGLLAASWAHAAQPNEMLSDQQLETRAHQIGEELRCLVCQNESIEDSNASLAHDLRMLLRQRLSMGDSDEAAKQYIVSRYGDYVLLKPPFMASTLILWLGPLLLILIALLVAAGFYRQQKKSSGPPETKRTTSQSRLNQRELRNILAIAVPIILIASVVLYIYLGSPLLSDRPFADRQDDPEFKLNAAAEIIAAKLEVHPDAAGYRHLSGMFYALHRYDRSAEAAHHATELDPRDSEAWSQLGESIVMENDGAVVMDALSAFKAALKHDAKNPRALFYVGLAETEIGNLKKAVAIWRGLEKTAPADAPWLPMITRNIVLYSQQGGFDPESIPPQSGLR